MIRARAVLEWEQPVEDGVSQYLLKVPERTAQVKRVLPR